MSFVGVNIIRKQGKFTTSVYHKPTFSRIYTHFDIYKFGIILTLLYRCFQICSDWSKFHFELVKLMHVFKSNSYPKNFINNCLKMFLCNKHRIQEKVITKKSLFLVLSSPLSLQTRTKLRKSLKGILNCDKLQIVFKSQNKLANAFRCNDRILKELISGVVYKLQCGLCNESYYDEYVRHVNVRTGEHIGISPLIKKVKPKGSAASDHLLFCNHSPSFESYSVLNKENKKFELELKESLLIMRDKHS